MIVIVSGPPGAGKTTIARRLAARRTSAVHLVSDEFFRWIVSGFVPPHQPEAHTQNEAVMDAVIAAVISYADAGYDVFWDGVVGPWWIDLVSERLGGRIDETHWLVLRPDRHAGVARVAERDGETETSGADEMNAQFADLGDDERFVIASDDAIDAVADRCAAAIEHRSHVLAGRTRTNRR